MNDPAVIDRNRAGSAEQAAQLHRAAGNGDRARVGQLARYLQDAGVDRSRAGIRVGIAEDKRAGACLGDAAIPGNDASKGCAAVVAPGGQDATRARAGQNHTVRTARQRSDCVVIVVQVQNADLARPVVGQRVSRIRRERHRRSSLDIICIDRGCAAIRIVSGEHVDLRAAASAAIAEPHLHLAAVRTVLDIARPRVRLRAVTVCQSQDRRRRPRISNQAARPADMLGTVVVPSGVVQVPYAPVDHGATAGNATPNPNATVTGHLIFRVHLQGPAVQCDALERGDIGASVNESASVEHQVHPIKNAGPGFKQGVVSILGQRAGSVGAVECAGPDNVSGAVDRQVGDDDAGRSAEIEPARNRPGGQ